MGPNQYQRTPELGKLRDRAMIDTQVFPSGSVSPVGPVGPISWKQTKARPQPPNAHLGERSNAHIYKKKTSWVVFVGFHRIAFFMFF